MKNEALENLEQQLKKRGFIASTYETMEEAREKAIEIIGERSVGFGSSMTVEKLGLYEELKNHGNSVYWHWKEEATPQLFADASAAEVYVCSANAITEQGLLINIDKTGNRTANTFYGPNPKTVIFIAGRNKICKDLEDGIAHIKNVVCPQNARRLHAKTPCAIAGKCMDCNSPDRLCRVITILERPSAAVEAVYVLLIDMEMGY